VNTYIILTYFTNGVPRQRLFRIFEGKVFEYTLVNGFQKIDCSSFWKEEERDVTNAKVIHSSEELMVKSGYSRYTLEDSHSKEVKGISYNLHDSQVASAFVAVVQNAIMN